MNRSACIVIACLVGIFVAVHPAQAQTPEVRYFPETGHNVRGEFLRFFETRGGVELFGYPLTEEFAEDGVQVQYFEKFRMEWHPENPKPYRVQLGLLGELLRPRDPPIVTSEIPPADHPQRRYYPETGHTVSFAFLTYFDEHGGLDIFGYPISEFVVESGLIVQYFQKACMEWHEDDPFTQVQLPPLGKIYLEKIGLDPSLLEPAQIQPDPSPTPVETSGQPVSITSTEREITALRATASVQYAITGGQNDTQTVHVYVTDRTGQGVEGAEVNLIVCYPTEDRHFLPLHTDAEGHAAHTFRIGNPLPGYIVIIDVTASHGEQTVITQTSFLPWW